MLNKLRYTVRYALLDSKTIFNMCGPEHAGPQRWDAEGLAARKTGAYKYITKLNERNNFFVRLEQSIKTEGFRNPILVNAGFCQPRKLGFIPPEMQEDPKKVLFCHSNGGSRLWIAAKLNI